jgi:H+-transporting ATPase
MADQGAAAQEQAKQLQGMSVDELLTRLHASRDGLSTSEAQRRLQRYGPNALAEEKRNPILTFLSYFWGPLPWMIEIADILSAVLRHWMDVAVISALLLINAVVGFWEEYQAGSTIAALKATLATRARVKRDGEWRDAEARELVPGDVIRLRLGDVVPADAKLLDGEPIQVDQSALTGESLPVDKKPGDPVFSGSAIKQGEIDGLVYATGGATYFGRTAAMVEKAHAASHLQRAVLKVGDYLILIALALAVLIFVVALMRHVGWLISLQYVLILTVAAVPVAMPTVLSVTMAVGARLLARRRAVVTKLESIEELAGVDVLCSDKTGTLTQNRLTLGDPFAVEGVSAEDIILAAALASREEDEDPIDLAVIGGVPDKSRLENYQVLDFMPFDPVHKRTAATVKDSDGKEFKVTKGAPQVIIDLAKDDDEVKSRASKAVDTFAEKGYRSLGVARADEDENWKLLGVLALYDPPREDSKTTLVHAKRLGVSPKMITGDQEAIAREIARQLGLGTNIVEAKVIEKEGPDSPKVMDLVEKADGFAEVFPEHKFAIVSALQKMGHAVGMTGDGVNDAPALKKADAGIAVSGATDAARSAADIVLLTPGLSVIVRAIRESRRIFERMNSYTTYRIAETIDVLLFVTLSILFYHFYPLTAIMIVLLAILNDGAIISIAYDHTTLARRPETWHMRRVLTIATVLGLFRVAESFGLLYLGDRVLHLARPMLSTLLYLGLSVGGHLTVFAARTHRAFWSIRPSAVLLSAVVGTQLVATLISVYGLLLPPLGWTWAGLVWGYVIVGFLIQDQLKLLAYRVLDAVTLPHRARH